MIRKTKTGRIQGNAEYSFVKDRVKLFREDNPRGDIITEPTILEDGKVLFKATAIKDKSDEASASATGHALSTKAGVKDFEKLETTAVGRALALLGYMADGEIASAEEMQEYEAFKEAEKEERKQSIEIAVSTIKKAKTIDELKEFFTSLIPDIKNEVEVANAKNNRYGELNNVTKAQTK
jgi:hypothetical protein